MDPSGNVIEAASAMVIVGGTLALSGLLVTPAALLYGAGVGIYNCHYESCGNYAQYAGAGAQVAFEEAIDEATLLMGSGIGLMCQVPKTWRGFSETSLA